MRTDPPSNSSGTPGSDAAVETLRYCGGALELIDQRLLPLQFAYVRTRDAGETARAIREMVVRGAPAIGCTAAYGYALEAIKLSSRSIAEFDRGLAEGFAVLAESRPTAINLHWALERMRAVHRSCAGSDTGSIAARLMAEAESIRAEDIEINRRMGAFGAALLRDGMRVLTHCNAGALATAGHGTALGVIRSAVESGKNISVFADETRPFLQGARLTAWELRQDGIPVTLITDNMSGHLMSRGEIDAVVVGTDRVAANGDVANKIGTYMVAVLAHRHRIPFYVACPLSTIDVSVPNGSAIPIEERDPAEVFGFGSVRWAPDGVSARHPAFDVTPAELVTGLVTEHGVIESPNAAGIARLMATPGRSGC